MSNPSLTGKNSLCKKKFILMSILGLVLFANFANIVLARPPEGVEIKDGDVYKWIMKLNISNFIELVTDTGQGSIPTEMLPLSLPGEVDLIDINIILEILRVPGEFSYNSFFDVWTTLTEATVGLAPDYNISEIPTFYPLNFTIHAAQTPENFSILRADTSNYFSIPSGFLLVVATDLNWTKAAAELETVIRDYNRINFGISDSAVEPQDLGLTIIQSAGIIIKDIEFNLSYNSRGVLELFTCFYGGPELISVEYLGDDTSIAFEIPFYLGVFIIALIALIVRKRKKLYLFS